jgi:formylglycine-generating enzyme required for sulfatase activity
MNFGADRMRHTIGLVFIVSALLRSGTTQAQEKTPPKHFTNSIGMKFVLVPAGTFTMGSPNSEKGRGDDEYLRKLTFSKGLYMGIHPVTQEQWQAIMGANPSHFQGENNLPVEQVSWSDCQAFCKKLGAREKKLYRLPTEAEWEYACRAGTTTAFHFGATISTEQANYNGNFIFGLGKKGIHREKTTPVGTFPANAWGLYDMHGNVWQWCQDWHGGYSRTELTDPQGPKSGKNRVLRGGSWGSHPIFCRCANRNFADPESRTEYYGVRICFSAETEK